MGVLWYSSDTVRTASDHNVLKPSLACRCPLIRDDVPHCVNNHPYTIWTNNYWIDEASVSLQLATQSALPAMVVVDSDRASALDGLVSRATTDLNSNS